jgi:hypothetical protein
MIQHFALILILYTGNGIDGYSAGVITKDFNSFDLCRSALERLQRETQDSPVTFKAVCVPIEEKHK